jgi:TatD DNase family protein
MLVDTHCHINMMIKTKFDVPIVSAQLPDAKLIVKQAQHNQVNYIINVGTSLIESLNCIELAKACEKVYATVGIHPNDCTKNWQNDFQQLTKLVEQKEQNKIVGIGECGFDKHYPAYNLQRQKDAFKAHVDLALKHSLPLVIHTRDAADETLTALEEYKKEAAFNGVIHCFSEDLSFAKQVIEWNFVLGFGGTITYPMNDKIRDVAKIVSLKKIVLETDAPFLPPQIIRGQENHPKYILAIAEFLADLRNQPFQEIAEQTTTNALDLFGIKQS